MNADPAVDVSAIDPVPSGSHNVPPHLPRFVGRGREITELIGLLGNERLITLTGAPGIGKSRLAVEVATHTQDMYANGAWLVELAPVCDPDLVSEAVACALGLEPEPGRDPIEAAIARLTPGASLLVLDNCEHVLAASSAVVDRLLASCPQLRILATSQQPLGVAGERSVPVGPLSLVDAPRLALTDGGVQSEAVALFSVRAAAAHPGFRLTEEVLPAVLDICRRLDGIPLAIELAAARIAALGAADIAERLEGRFRLLTGGPPTSAARHQTLQAALDWSYDLLISEEATLLRRLSVFVGGADLHTVEEVCTGRGVPRDDTVDLLTSLVAKSLVCADTSRSRARYRLLETIRAYASERLEEEGEVEALRARHAAWAVSLAERAWHQVGTGNQHFWADALEADHDNIRSAFDWAVANRPELALRLGAALTPFWKARGYFQEGQERLARALAASPDGPKALRARALYGLALMAMMRGDIAAARPAAEESLALARAGSLRRAEAQTLSLLGFISIFAQDPRAAKPVLEEAVAQVRTEGDPGYLVQSLALLGQAHLFLADIEAARKVFEECISLAEGGDADLSKPLVGMARTALAAGEDARSEELFRRALTLLRDVGERFETALVLSFLGELAWARGDLAEAHALLEEGRELALVMGAPFPLAQCLCGLARVAAAESDPQTAGALADEACDVATKAGLPYALVRALHVRGDLQRASGDTKAARTAYEDALALARANDDRGGVAASLHGLARLARSGGDDQQAVALLGEALTLQAETGDGGVVSSLELMAGLAADQGRTTVAAGLFGAAQHVRDVLGSIRRPDDMADFENDLARLRSALDPDELHAAWAKGAKMSRDDAVALALRGRGPRDRPTYGWASLTPAELQVVELVAEGLTNREIGEKLFMSARTVQGHLTRVFPKLDVTSRRQIREALRHL